jgi:hypothetical protein
VPQQWLPRFYRHQEELEDARKLAKIILETDNSPAVSKNGKPLTRSADGHDPARLRGLPAIGRNVSGASPGTNPVAALLRKERERRL